MAPKQKEKQSSRDLRHRLLTCVTKLGDKDTLSQAVSELESIIPTLTSQTSFSLFINSLSSTSSADRSAVRVASLKLLSSLSSFHASSLSPHLPKLLSAVIRRLRDPDSAVRSSAASATASFSSHVSPSSLSPILRPLADSLSSEQEFSAQSAAAMCLSAAIDSSPCPSPDALRAVLPKWIRLLKCDAFKAKASLIVLLTCALRVSVSDLNLNLLRDLVHCFLDFLKCDVDWAARKAAADALNQIALVVDPPHNLSDLKPSCLDILQSRKFDKVKAVREAMNQTLEAWRKVPDVVYDDDDGSPPPLSLSQHSTKENASVGSFPTKPRVGSAADSNTPQTSKKRIPFRRSSPMDSALKITARNRGGAGVTGKRPSLPVSRKLDPKKPSETNADATDRHGGYSVPDDEGVLPMSDVRSSKQETKQGHFGKTPASHFVPYPENDSEPTVAVSNTSADICRHHKDFEDLNLIRKQLVQIENQQSSLMDLLQKFIGSSQDGMRTLETRVHGLEQALDGISYDLALSTARISSAEAARSSCCLLPGSDFFSSKFWRRPEGRCSTSWFSFSGTTSASAIRSVADKRPGDTVGLGNCRFGPRVPGGVIMNPLAENHGHSSGASEVLTSRVLQSVRNVA